MLLLLLLLLCEEEAAGEDFPLTPCRTLPCRAVPCRAVPCRATDTHKREGKEKTDVILLHLSSLLRLNSVCCALCVYVNVYAYVYVRYIKIPSRGVTPITLLGR